PEARVAPAGNPVATPAPGLKNRRVAGACQCLRTRGHESDPVLVGLDLLRHADEHGRLGKLRKGSGVASRKPRDKQLVTYFGPNRNTVCRSGLKNSLATSRTPSDVTASISASIASSGRYGSPCSSNPARRPIRAAGLSSDSMIWPLSCCLPSVSSPSGRPLSASRSYSPLIAAIASSADPGWVPT